VFVLFGSMACFCYSYFSTFMSFGQFLPLFFFVLFYFRLSPRCILPLCFFSLSLCITFSLSFYYPSFSIFFLFSTFVSLRCCFCVSVFVSVLLYYYSMNLFILLPTTPLHAEFNHRHFSSRVTCFCNAASGKLTL
jgi:hypothetical protein